MAVTNPDDLFENFVKWTLWLWGPFYALLYIFRLAWKEFFQSDEEEV